MNLGKKKTKEQNSQWQSYGRTNMDEYIAIHQTINNTISILKAKLYLMLKERMVQVDIKATPESDIGRIPFDRICHVQMFSYFQRLWDILSEINMNNLQGNKP